MGPLPPMLMSVALRFLPPGIRLYGLGSYALTATFGPSFGTPLSAWWVEYAGWQWAFWQIIPLGLLSMAVRGLGLAARPVAPGAVQTVRLAWPAAGLAGADHAGAGAGIGTTPELV